ncbi:hypothetical protein BGW36DRAFT_425745 [Talaromyces proteolyticus]|uniref:Xylanolytic transcriptional activator regulatory domain-containing protein n=1 Tax=Talaromyces proteolyticus TaxID=1131652 RepID=A0AAD4KZG7_9EURO|nr:uncharacterized protein BGW36DRAFT_425745 [Talaromyces proteolyticus]KAH8700946.1 hypothetical protein BGW36DRAFT_425745 [Talaromyces proteolyticus]
MEKRQRVLISTRYDEAMESVDRVLQEVLQGVNKIVEKTETWRRSPMDHQASPANIVTSNLLEASSTVEGYRGDSSFNAHVKRVADTLKNAASDIGSISDSPAGADSQHIYNAMDTSELASQSSADSQVREPIQFPELEGRSLPPMHPVLSLLRMIQDEKQPLFFNIPIMDEKEFTDLCQKVYFAIQRYSVMTWTIVNAGLYYLFLSIEEEDYDRLGVSAPELNGYIQILSANVEAVMANLRMILEPSVESCQALAFLSMFVMRSGQISMTWRLNSAAARMCIELGLHRLPHGASGRNIARKRKVFWHIYTMDKGLAMTLGRTPSIHQYDVATEKPAFPEDLSKVSTYDLTAFHLHSGFLDYGIISGEMYIELFSASAQRVPQDIRIKKAEHFAGRLMEVNDNVQKLLQDEPPTDTNFECSGILLDIMMHCLVTIVYRIVPCQAPNSHPLQCSDGCVDAARKALAAIDRARQAISAISPAGWVLFLNTLFALVPFTPFIVLAGNTVAKPSAEDLNLLWSALTSIEAMSHESPSSQKLYNTCKAFYQFAEDTFSRKMKGVTSTGAESEQLLFNANISHPASVWENEMNETSQFEQAMAPQAWGAFMSEFVNEHDTNFEPATLASVLEPYLPLDQEMRY